jgi:hypothetical protein
MFKTFKILFLLIILIILGFVFYNNRVVIKEYFSEPEKIDLPEEIKFEEIHGDIVEKEVILKDDNVDVEFVETQGIASPLVNENNNVEEINLAVPFTIQSPDQKWDEPYKEGCEEASILMVQSFLNDQSITVDSALTDIGVMVDWQMENYEGHFDLPVSMTVQVAKEFLNLKAEIIYLESIEDIKEIIKTGYPLILPTAGRELGNPNFTGEGPLYHMLVVKGFLEDGSIITNDPGTRRGENYIYDQDVLWNAIADWDRERKNPDQNIKVGILLK